MINLWIPTVGAQHFFFSWPPCAHFSALLTVTSNVMRPKPSSLFQTSFSQVANFFPAAQTWQLRFVSTLLLCGSNSLVADTSDITGWGKPVDTACLRRKEYFITEIVLQGSRDCLFHLESSSFSLNIFSSRLLTHSWSWPLKGPFPECHPPTFLPVRSLSSSSFTSKFLWLPSGQQGWFHVIPSHLHHPQGTAASESSTERCAAARNYSSSCSQPCDQVRG